ncbi:MAG: glycosyltransferase family 4 protein [Candidatus Tectomicrobia bacterium]|uniref:Glycosyltransferase family 4 protein n=1 Tax=Tectimicrobiota bacterium TaxID=2528274 RepID=A0A937W182_UNCTE|nr:glycosyltransferase family 4 protein [Candidatus Tectomicrobia bacterium]
MRNALIYLTYNGIYNFTNGIGTQTQLFLSGLECLLPTLEQQYGSIHLYVLCPQPDALTWGYDAQWLQRQEARLTALGGTLHYLPYKTQPQDDLWTVPRWHALCGQAARYLARLSAAYDRCLLLPVDQPWLQTPLYMAHLEPAAFQRIQALLVLYSTAFIRQAAAPDAEEQRWEHEGLALAMTTPNVAIADLCPSFTAHLRAWYQMQTAAFAPYTSSVLTTDPIFTPLASSDVRTLLQHYDVPLERDLVVAFGRATPLKGFDTLVPALQAVRERCHFVLISVAYPGETYQERYDQLLTAYGIASTHVKTFTRELPRALCQWPRTRMVVVPSHQETFSNIPLEVALWAQHQGPIVVASQVGGFVDQIEDGVSGFFLDRTSSASMGQTVQRVLDLSPEQHSAIRRQAYARVVQRYDFQHNFPEMLRWFWSAASRQKPREAPAKPDVHLCVRT